MTKFPISRRGLLTGLGVTGLIASCDSKKTELAPAKNRQDGIIRFEHGVASGDPLPNGVIIWTRVTTSNQAPVEVKWEVARDIDFRSIVKKGQSIATAARDHCVKLDVTGLNANQTYFYRFSAAGSISAVGRTRTVPKSGTDPLRLAILSCSHYGFGYFNVYQTVSQRDDIDLILHLGDYIYEYSVDGYGRQASRKLGRIPQPAHELLSLEDYRGRHAQYKSDADLQAAHASAPWICIWDDHESANNAYKEGAKNHQAGEGDWNARKKAAIRTYFDWMPIREPKSLSEEKNPASLMRDFRWGDLADLFMLETRLSGRDPQLDYTTEMVYRAMVPGLPELPDVVKMRELLADPDRYMIAPAQEKWLQDGLERSLARGAIWQLLGNQILMASMKLPNMVQHINAKGMKLLDERIPEIGSQVVPFSALGLPMNTDAWDGYAAQRSRIYDMIRNNNANTVVLTGDTHTFWLNGLQPQKQGSETRYLAAELGTSSVTSPSFSSFFEGVYDQLDTELMKLNEEVLYTNGVDHGYIYVKLTADQLRADYMKISTVTERQFEVSKLGTATATPSEGVGLGSVKAWQS